VGSLLRYVHISNRDLLFPDQPRFIIAPARQD
jgi:hypothetical protein